MSTPQSESPIDNIATYDTPVQYRGQQLRLVLSKLRPGMDQPWWLLTNLQTSPKKLLDRYAARWEIESMFRDMKHIQGLVAVRLRLAASLHNLLLFASLAWAWLAPLVADILDNHPKKALSWFHYLFERLVRSWSPASPAMRPSLVPP